MFKFILIFPLLFISFVFAEQTSAGDKEGSAKQVMLEGLHYSDK